MDTKNPYYSKQLFRASTFINSWNPNLFKLYIFLLSDRSSSISNRLNILTLFFTKSIENNDLALISIFSNALKYILGVSHFLKEKRSLL